MLKSINLPDCKPGMLLSIKKGNEEWIGILKALKKPGKYVLLVDVPTYIKDGTKRDRWQQKLVTFANSSKLTVEYDVDAWEKHQQKLKDFRKAYAGARNLLQERREEMHLNFAALGLKPNCTYDDFNSVRRAGNKKFHPDIVNQRVATLPSEEAAKLQRDSKTFLDACAWVSDYLQRTQP